MKYKVKSAIIHGREGEQVYQYEAGSEIELTPEEAEKVKNNIEPISTKEIIIKTIDDKSLNEHFLKNKEVISEAIKKASKPRKHE